MILSLLYSNFLSTRINWASDYRFVAHNQSQSSGSTTSSEGSAQVHVSFRSSQKLVTEDFLRDIFQRFGDVVEVAIKRSNFQPGNKSFAGFGFVHFPLSPEGVNSAVEACRRLNQVQIDFVIISCTMSHGLQEFLQTTQKSPLPPAVSTAVPLPTSTGQLFDNFNTGPIAPPPVHHHSNNFQGFGAPTPNTYEMMRKIPGPSPSHLVHGGIEGVKNNNMMSLYPPSSYQNQPAPSFQFPSQPPVPPAATSMNFLSYEIPSNSSPTGGNVGFQPSTYSSSQYHIIAPSSNASIPSLTSSNSGSHMLSSPHEAGPDSLSNKDQNEQMKNLFI